MPTAARPADDVEAAVTTLVQRAQAEGQMSLAQLRTHFDAAGIGPDEARTVLRKLTESGVVIGSDEPRKTSRRAGATRPATTAKAATRPAGRPTGGPGARSTRTWPRRGSSASAASTPVR